MSLRVGLTAARSSEAERESRFRTNAPAPIRLPTFSLMTSRYERAMQ